MTDKEKEAVEYLNGLDKTKIFYNNPPSYNNLSMGGAIEIAMKLIQTQQEVIDEMAKEIYEEDTIFGFGIFKEINTPEKIKEYFINKVEKESKDE